MSETATRRWLALTGLVMVVGLVFGALSRRGMVLVTPPHPAVATYHEPAARQLPAAAPRPAVLRHPLPHPPRRSVRRVVSPHIALVRDLPLVVTGAPSISAGQVNGVLAREGSPLAGLGAYVVARGRRWGIDPVFLLAFVTYFDGRDRLPAAAHNVGHIRVVDGEPSIEGYRAYSSWRAGVEAWYRLIHDLYVQRWRLRTLDDILPIYAPGSQRAVESELNAMRAIISAWRASGQ